MDTWVTIFRKRMESIEDKYQSLESRMSTVEGKIDAVLAMNVLVIILTFILNT